MRFSQEIRKSDNIMVRLPPLFWIAYFVNSRHGKLSQKLADEVCEAFQVFFIIPVKPCFFDTLSVLLL